MNVIDAAHKTVHDYPGGSESLGPRIGMSPAVLRSKVNPNTSTHHLTLAEAAEIMGVTGDHRVLQALAADLGYTLQKAEAATPASVISAHLVATVAKGELASVLVKALDDGRVSPNEAKLIGCAAADLQTAVMHLVQAAYRDAGHIEVRRG